MNRRIQILRYERLEPRAMLAAAPLGPEIQLNDQLVGRQLIESTNQALTVLSDGTVVAAYQGRGQGDLDGVFIRQFDDDGSPLGDSQLVNVTSADVQSSAAVSPLPDGGFVVAWDGRGLGDRHGVFARWYDSDFDPLTDELLVNETVGGWQEQPKIAVSADGTTNIVWQGVGDGDFSGVFMRQFSASGVATSSEQRINTFVQDEQAFADVEALTSGELVVTWSSRHQDGSDWGVYAQRVAADGALVGTEQPVNSQTDASQVRSTVSAEESGGFVIGWDSHGQDGDGWGVYAQRFDANAESVGDEIQIHVDAAGQQRDVALTSLGEATVLAVWSDGKLDAAGWEVHGRIVALGSAGESEQPLVVNVGSTGANSGHQQFPVVVQLSTEQALVAWTGRGSADRNGVHAQIVGLDVDANAAPDLTPIPDQTGRVGEELELTIIASDTNPSAQLTFALDPDNSPSDAVLEQLNNNTAVVRWTPSADDLPGPTLLRVLVIDDGNPPMADAEEFFVMLTDSSASTATAPDSTINSALDAYFSELGA